MVGHSAEMVQNLVTDGESYSSLGERMEVLVGASSDEQVDLGTEVMREKLRVLRFKRDVA